MMSDTLNILNLFHEPFKHHGSQNWEHYDNEETRNRIFENLNLNVFLTKILDVNSSIYDDKTNFNYYNLEHFDFIQLFTKNSVLVSSFHVCS